jgi:hypothetical protein
MRLPRRGQRAGISKDTDRSAKFTYPIPDSYGGDAN